ncbi:hypothetical protein ACSU1N_02730 [Thermogladius sp. 4427co]|uniref:hypothetical protein n=1 Tax=Thermogladius sp. 4427co TaxID=3450718 RepID=UPI003F796F57
MVFEEESSEVEHGEEVEEEAAGEVEEIEVTPSKITMLEQLVDITRRWEKVVSGLGTIDELKSIQVQPLARKTEKKVKEMKRKKAKITRKKAKRKSKKGKGG